MLLSFQKLCPHVQIGTKTIPGTDGEIHKFCGIMISNKETIKESRTTPVQPAMTAEGNENIVEESGDSIPGAYTSSGVQPTYAKLGSPESQCRFCGAIMWAEEKSTSSNATTTNFILCCQEGRVSLSKLANTPEPLKTLLRDQGPQGTSFRSKIRIYNSIFCFTSFGARVDEKINESRGPYTFRISGQNYHRVGSLLPQEGRTPRFAQLYFYDTENEVKNRMGCMNLTDADIDKGVVSKLTKMLDSNSSVVKAFRMARDWCSENESNQVSLKLIGERKPTDRQYNLPTVSEVAALVIGDFGQTGATRDVVIRTTEGVLQRISELHPLYMSLQYPLLFPYGEDGFHLNISYATNSGIKKRKRGCVTMREYYSYRLQQRLTEGTSLIEGGHLLNQYCVDAYTAVEEQRLGWIRFNQKELRADLYNNICDAIERGDTDAKSIGKRIILPSSFTGGPRYMAQNYQDAMALCRAFGNPSLFITFKANPKWPEVAEMLAKFPGRTASDRPDIMARVFRLKLKQLMTDLRKENVFGQTQAAVYTIEFQKRGLPHAHILLWLKRKNSIATASEIDEMISAEIPSKEEHPELHTLVSEHMVHGPCGISNKNSACMIEGKCSKHFPKAFYADTTVDQDGFPVYRRRNNGVVTKKARSELDNRHVVPYNAYLLLKYHSHINVEWCNQSRAIKYLFKYINKGPDRTTALISHKRRVEGTTSLPEETEVDEIKIYLECRYLSACEAVWRILGFEIHSCKPAVIRLPFHLTGENTVTVQDSQNLTSILNRDGISETMFTAWMSLNKVDPRAKALTYAELPRFFVWNATEKNWQWRKERPAIGRIVYCNPAAGERYYLRMLLNSVKGPTDFEAIRTVNGIVHETYRKTCYALGMLTDDKEWTDALQEASVWATGVQLRQLFVTILLFCDVTSAKTVWDANWEALSEDVLYRKRKEFRFPNLELTEQQVQNYCLLDLEEILSKNGKSLADYSDMPLPDKTLLTSLDNRLIREELSYNICSLAEEHGKLKNMLNDQQLDIYNKVVESVHQQLGRFYFVYGAGGTGKTFLYTTIMARLRSERYIVLAVASSGIASLLLPGGRTAHSRFLIPLELLDSSTCGISQNSQLAQLLHEVKLIIWDEAPMTQRYAFEALNRTLQDIQGLLNEDNRQKIFGGITVVLGGDFRQILPVIPKGKRQDIVQSCINNSILWEECEVLKLSHSMRVNEHQEDGSIDKEKKDFNEWILQLGEGTAPAISMEGEDEATWVEIPSKFIIDPGASPIQQLLEAIYPDFAANQTNKSYLQERAILTPLNEDADRINEQMFHKVIGQVRVYKSSDEVCLGSTDVAVQENLYPTEYLNSLNFPGMPSHELHLKEGLPVMLLRNVNPTQGLCNGTRLLITRLGDWVVEAEIITGSNVGSKVLIPRITMTSPSGKWPFVLKRRQFPIKPCFAMTVNKSQGQSLKQVGLYLPKPVFCHGQLYVAVSRVTDPQGLKILMLRTENQPVNRTKNIVYKEAFNNLNTATQAHARLNT